MGRGLEKLTVAYEWMWVSRPDSYKQISKFLTNKKIDLLLTNSKKFITDNTVFPDKYLCKSDHYLITFEVKSNVKHK